MTNIDGIVIDQTLTLDELRSQFAAAREVLKSDASDEEKTEAGRLAVALNRRINELVPRIKGRGGFASRAGQRQYNERKALERRRY